MLRQRRNLGCENVLRICSAYACATGCENQCLPSLGAAGPRPKESLSQTEGDMGSLDTAASPKVFTHTQKQTSTLLDEAGRRARGSGCEAVPASPLDQGSEPALAPAP